MSRDTSRKSNMSLNFVLFLTISFQVVAISLSCQPPQNCENATSSNSTPVSMIVNCSLSNISCGFGKVCRGGACIDAESNAQDEGDDQFPSMGLPYKTESETLTTLSPTKSNNRDKATESSHSLISGNQEFAIALVGFSILFINFCLISFCMARMKRRRLQQQRRSQRSAATQSSQTGDDWDESNIVRNRGIENFALNGDLDAFGSEFMYSPVHLPPYDFSSAYHKPRPRLEDSEEDGAKAESSEAAVDTQSIPANEDPPPYSDQRYEGSKPPSYEAINVEECTSGL